MVLEVGFKLDKDLSYYQEILKRANAELVFCCETHDIYWTKKENFDNMTENQIKMSCVRLRICRKLGSKKWTASFSNYKLFDNNYDDKFEIKASKFRKYDKVFRKNNFKMAFDTYKIDYQYKTEQMQSRIQLQQIKDIGLLLYYDNPNYYNLSESEQKNALIKELNSYGFNFDINTLGLDKLRTLYYKKELFSINQNG